MTKWKNILCNALRPSKGLQTKRISLLMELYACGGDKSKKDIIIHLASLHLQRFIRCIIKIEAFVYIITHI